MPSTHFRPYGPDGLTQPWSDEVPCEGGRTSLLVSGEGSVRRPVSTLRVVEWRWRRSERQGAYHRATVTFPTHPSPPPFVLLVGPVWLPVSTRDDESFGQLKYKTNCTQLV